MPIPQTTQKKPYQNQKLTKPLSVPVPVSVPTISINTHTQQGFTLIEVMVALAILSVVAIAATQASSTYLQSVDNLKTRTLAHFVAQNTAAQLQINPQWSQTQQVGQVDQQGRRWQVSIIPMSMGDISSNNTLSGRSGQSYEGLKELTQPVSIEVAPIKEQQGETGSQNGQAGQVRHSISSVTVMVNNPSADHYISHNSSNDSSNHLANNEGANNAGFGVINGGSTNAN